MWVDNIEIDIGEKITGVLAGLLWLKIRTSVELL
jgi:hypothetical protein